MLLKQLASKERVAKMMQEGQDTSWADVLTAIGAGGGGIAKLLGTDVGGGNTIGSYLGKGAGSLTKGIGRLFSDDIGLDDIWSGSTYDFTDWDIPSIDALDSMGMTLADYSELTSMADAWDAF